MRTPYIHSTCLALVHLACFSLLLSLFGTSTASAIDTEKAEILFESGRYELAKTHFLKAIEQHAHPSLHYNVALIDLKLNQLASARWQIEQARMLAPMQSKYRLLEAHILEQLELPAQNTLFVEAARFLSLNQWSLVASFAFWGCVWLLIVAIYGSRSPARNLIICSGLLLLFSFSLYARNLQIARQASAIVSEKSSVGLLSAPTKNAPQIGSFAYGERLQVLKKHLDYVQVLGRDNTSGWLPESQLSLFPKQASLSATETAPSEASN